MGPGGGGQSGGYRRAAPPSGDGAWEADRVHCRRDTITSIADAFASSVGIGLFTETVASSWWRGPVGAATASEGHVVDHHQLALISPWGRKCTERRGDIWLFGCGRNGG